MAVNKFTKMVLVPQDEYEKCFKKKAKKVSAAVSLPQDQKIKITQKKAAINRSKIRRAPQKKWQAL
jgi:hypothetical protein